MTTIHPIDGFSRASPRSGAVGMHSSDGNSRMDFPLHLCVLDVGSDPRRVVGLVLCTPPGKPDKVVVRWENTRSNFGDWFRRWWRIQDRRQPTIFAGNSSTIETGNPADLRLPPR